jgi:CRISPR system Cascade subunit CasA
MSLNLLRSAWLPVRRRQSGFTWISLAGLAPSGADDDQVVALAFPRPDWNAAVLEFLIGSIQAAFAPADLDDWHALWITPPNSEGFAQALAPLAWAFDVGAPGSGLGNGPRAFQDFDTLNDAESKDVAQLLIDAPGAITLTKNTDHFIKRGRTDLLCLPYAMAALITLQTYAPSGGAGHRTSMRGGGPMTTLIDPANLQASNVDTQTLWAKIWANVGYVPEEDDVPSCWPQGDPHWAAALPWLAPTHTSAGNEEIGPGGISALWLPYFACPRRIRLDIAADGKCALGGPGTFGVVAGYHTQNYGANYTNWMHPLTPYRAVAKGGSLPIHPNPGSRSYSGWVGVWGGGETKGLAQPLKDWRKRAHRAGLPTSVEVSAFGYNMDNMKARAWVDSTVPFYHADGDSHAVFLENAKCAIDAASKAASALGKAVMHARAGRFTFDTQGISTQWRKQDNAKHELADDARHAFWQETETEFRGWLDTLSRSPHDRDEGQRERWRKTLMAAVYRLFDRYADMPDEDCASSDQLKKWAVARSELGNFAWKDITKALGLSTTEPKTQTKRAPKKAKSTALLEGHSQ